MYDRSPHDCSILAGEILKSREAKSHLRGQYQSSEQEMRNKKKEMKVTELSLQRHDKQAKKVNSTVLQLEQRKEALQEEAASPFMEDLDSQDSEDVRELNQEITDLKQKQIETAAIRGNLGTSIHACIHDTHTCTASDSFSLLPFFVFFLNLLLFLSL